jgi:hypothetical protein
MWHRLRRLLVLSRLLPASAVAAAAVEEIPPATPTEDTPPALADETAPSVSASITKIDESWETNLRPLPRPRTAMRKIASLKKDARLILRLLGCALYYELRPLR